MKNYFLDNYRTEKVKEILPILVLYAKSNNKITYKELGEKVGIYWRKLDAYLGDIGNILKEVFDNINEEPIMIQSLVVRGDTGVPGDGIASFIFDLIDEDRYKKLSPKDKKVIIKIIHERIWNYKKWDNILRLMDLIPLSVNKTLDPFENKEIPFSVGEGDDHKKLKNYIYNNPQKIGINPKAEKWMEYYVPSGDSLDVFFKTRKELIAVEVKGKKSNINDIRRGLYQCVKYNAILNAMKIESQESFKCMTYLILEEQLPNELIELRNLFSINVIENAYNYTFD